MSDPIISGNKPLPAPFADVQLDFQAAETGIVLRYTGTAERLIAAGAVEPSMTECLGRNNKARFDSMGEYYHLETRYGKRGAVLAITRFILVEAFAASLPGCPRLPTFDLLDRLDAQPDHVHVRTEEVETYGGVRVNRLRIGTAAALASSGISSNLLDRQFGRPCWRIPAYRLWNGSKLTIRRLMRGYFEVEDEISWHRTSSTTSSNRSAVAALPAPRLASHLRLAWTNPAVTPGTPNTQF